MYTTTIKDETGKTVFETTGKIIMLVHSHERDGEEDGGCYGFSTIDGSMGEIILAVRALDRLKGEVFERLPKVKAMCAVADAVGSDNEVVTDLSELLRALTERGKEK